MPNTPTLSRSVTPKRPKSPKRPARRKAKAAQPPAQKNQNLPQPQLPSDFPHWLPTVDRWRSMPENIRQAVAKIVAPAYRRFVLDAPSELERSVGVTLVHLAWLELCGQANLAIAVGDPKSLEAITSDTDAMIDRHLRLTTAKCQAADLLLKLRMADEALQRLAPLSPAPLAPPTLLPPAEGNFNDEDPPRCIDTDPTDPLPPGLRTLVSLSESLDPETPAPAPEIGKPTNC